MTYQLLYLVMPPQTADLVTEWLLDRPDVPGFTSVPAAGHGSSEHSMTVAEQVAGYTAKTLLLIHLPPEASQSVLDDLGKDFSDSGIHHWRVPVMDQGRL
ncbi:DUF3240 family protein [Ectothiorhodospira lacustris]|uniref:DUF3240 family protein n=1 Tax=Ectothiorhodospira lacustris TaxID=2899127 RepID=UPI001EE8328B|nr:DUF3240 family protein [Ectothiorhodospira lacustris]MCG5509502.1 DUF3240 family protein [Ectothiorhodospira lacustris]